MQENVSQYPPAPFWYKKEIGIPPEPPEEGEFSMFGRTYTVICKKT